MAAALAATRREFALEARQGRGGREAQARYAARMDAVVTQLVEAAALADARRRWSCVRSAATAAGRSACIRTST